MAAYTLPGVVGALVFGHRLRRVSAGRLLLAELLPDEQRLAANTPVSSLSFAAIFAGPAIAGVLVTHVSAAAVLGLDALTYVFLAVLVARMRLPESGLVSLVDQAAARGGLVLLRSHPELLGLLTLAWFFNLLYGPVEVALPLHVTDDLHAPGSLLGLYWMLFGVGAVFDGARPASDARRLRTRHRGARRSCMRPASGSTNQSTRSIRNREARVAKPPLASPPWTSPPRLQE